VRKTNGTDLKQNRLEAVDLRLRFPDPKPFSRPFQVAENFRGGIQHFKGLYRRHMESKIAECMAG